MKDKFQLEKEDYKVIRFTEKYIRNVLKEIELTPLQIIGFGNYLYALERLPLITPGVDNYIELKHSDGDQSSWVMKSYGFTLNEDTFHIDVSGYAQGSQWW